MPGRGLGYDGDASAYVDRILAVAGGEPSAAERNGFEYALSQIRFTAGYGAEYQHESVAISHALLAATDKLRVIAAILPGPWHPAVLAKQISTISHLTNGRIAVNIVSGWFRSEFTAIGEPWLEHDERYDRAERGRAEHVERMVP